MYFSSFTLKYCLDVLHLFIDFKQAASNVFEIYELCKYMVDKEKVWDPN